MYVFAVPAARLAPAEVAAAEPHLILPSLEAFNLALLGHHAGTSSTGSSDGTAAADATPPA